jgi:hypothetical protein
MKVGDLVREKGYPEIGLIVDKIDKSDVITYKVMCLSWSHWASAQAQWFPREYIEKDCELISAAR